MRCGKTKGHGEGIERGVSCAAGNSDLATIRGVMGVEYRAAVRMVAAPDFAEGVRRAPRFDAPARLLWHVTGVACREGQTWSYCRMCASG